MDTETIDQKLATEGVQVGVLHVHSDYSPDGRDSLESLYEWAADRNISFLGLTDHAEDFELDLWEDFVEHCRELSTDRVRLIPGLEFRFRGFTGLHLLALGLREWITPQTPAEFIDSASRAAGLTIVAHPVLPRYHIPNVVLDGIDAIEIWNASYNTRYLPDTRAIRLLHQVRLARPGVVGTAGLDQHDRANDRQTRVLVSATATDPIAEVKAGRFTNVGRTMRFDAQATIHPAALGALSVARVAFDGMERIQDRVARVLTGSRSV
jgi:hypothetical protein